MALSATFNYNLPSYSLGSIKYLSWYSLVEMKKELGKAIGIFLAVAGLLAAVVQFWTSSGLVRSVAFICLLSTLIMLAAWLIHRNLWLKIKASRALPPIEQLDDICIGYHTAQASPEEMNWIADLEQQVYMPGDAVPRNVLKEWYNSNPTGFSVIRMKNGQKIGHIDLLPVRPATFSAFVEGQIIEKDIRGDSLYSPADRDLIRDLYVESVIVLPPKGYSNAPAVLCILREFGGLVQRVCDPQKVERVYAIAASNSGKRLLQRLGFDLIARGDKRADGHDLFVAAFADLASNIQMICGVRFPETNLSNGLSTKVNIEES